MARVEVEVVTQLPLSETETSAQLRLHQPRDHIRQAEVAREIAATIREACAAGEESPISGVMLESFLVAGAQSTDATPLTYGQSVTDKCMAWTPTAEVLEVLANI